MTRAECERWHIVHDDAIAAGSDPPTAVAAADAALAPSSRPDPPSSQELSHPEFTRVILHERVTRECAMEMVRTGRWPPNEVHLDLNRDYHRTAEVVHEIPVSLNSYDLQRAAYLKHRGELHDERTPFQRAGLRSVG